MASDKNVLALAILAKTEASYGAVTSVSAATDGIHIVDHPEFTLSYTYDGSQGTVPGTAGVFRRNAPSGRFATGKVKIYAKGLGNPYSTGSTPPSIHPFLLASGLSGSYAAGVYSYQPYALSPNPVSGSSVYIEAYRRGEKWPLTGGYCTFTLGTSNAAAPIFEFDVSAVTTIPTDAAPPTPVYPATSVVPPKAENVTLSIGSWTSAKVRSVKFELGRELHARTDIASLAGHAGFAPGARKPKFTVVVESPALSVFDAYTNMSNATVLPVSLTVGSVSTNKYQLLMSQSILTNVNPQEDGPVATWELVFQPTTSTLTSNDDFVLNFL